MHIMYAIFYKLKIMIKIVILWEKNKNKELNIFINHGLNLYT